MPTYGKGLCRLYMDKGCPDDAIGVAATCYAGMRSLVIDHPPVGKGFEPALQHFLLWAEICGNIYKEGRQGYMARMVFETTIQDLKRFGWDSPSTRMLQSSHTYYTGLFKKKLEGIGPDSDDESDEESDDEPPIPPERQLKLAVIEPSSDPDTPVRVTTNIFDIEKAPLYEALSYAWGDSRKVISYTRTDGPPYAESTGGGASAPVMVPILLNGNTVHIRKTLHQALLALRQRETKTTIWIDALCTNPVEIQKRAEWSLQLKEIYKRAREVVIWLGEGDEETLRGIQYLRDFGEEHFREQSIANFGDLCEVLFRQDSSIPWDALRRILDAEWWTRIWSVQEFVMAKTLSLRFGDVSAPWEQLCNFLGFVMRYSWRFQCCGAPTDPRTLSLFNLIKARSEYVNLRDRRRAETGYPLEQLWQATKSHESWDPRDKIFALVGLLDKTSLKYAPKVSYEFCPCAVYSDMMVFRNIGGPEALQDGPLAYSRVASGSTLLGLEQGTEEALKHVYTWNSERIRETCDGEACGRRQRCFADGQPEFPSRWGTFQVIEFMTKMYESYVEMKKVEQLAEVLALQAIVDAPQDRQHDVIKAALESGLVKTRDS
jgi:hypothetical protein